MASTADLIQELNNDLTAAYAAVEAKGGTVPEQKNAQNLASAVESITGGGGSDIPYFDGGEYGAIAYLNKDREVAYYVATSANDLLVNPSSGEGTEQVIKTLDDGTEILRSDVLAYSIGANDQHPSSDFFLRYFYSLRVLYGLDRANITSIGNYFLASCFSLNKPIVLPDTVKTIGSSFLTSCRGFNQPITLPTALESIGSNFLDACHTFNQPLTLPEGLKTIGTYFLSTCYSFNQPLTLPSGLSNIGDYFIYQCYSFTGPLNVSTASGFYSSNYTLTVTYKPSLAYSKGVTLTGTNAQAWRAGLPDRDTNPYRKLIVAGGMPEPE